MTTSKQILEATGLKSQKTLTRWAHAEVIPEPLIGTHPPAAARSPTGPIGCWKGASGSSSAAPGPHYSVSALATIEYERMLRTSRRSRRPGSEPSFFRRRRSSLPGGREVDLGSLLAAVVAKEAESVVADAALRGKLGAEVRKAGVAAQGLELIAAGYNPICLFDGRRTEVVPDFLVSHWLSRAEARPRRHRSLFRSWHRCGRCFPPWGATSPRNPAHGPLRRCGRTRVVHARRVRHPSP